jgi:hypothetical protein
MAIRRTVFELPPPPDPPAALEELLALGAPPMADEELPDGPMEPPIPAELLAPEVVVSAPVDPTPVGPVAVDSRPEPQATSKAAHKVEDKAM